MTRPDQQALDRTGAAGHRNGPWSSALLLLCAFPFVSVIATPFDTQPYALIGALVASLYVFASRGELRVPKLLLPFGLVLGYATLTLLAALDLSLPSLRSLVGYVSVCVLSVAAFLTFGSVRARYFLFAVHVWLFFGVVQLVVTKGFGSFLLPRLTTDQMRGVTSLAVEPSLYAVTCIYFLVVNDVFYAIRAYSRRSYLWVLAILVLQIFLARAGLGIVLLFVYLAARSFSRTTVTGVFKGVAGLAALLLAFVLAFQSLPALRSTRAGVLLTKALTHPAALSSDISITDRLAHILISHLSVFHGHPLGFGLGTWGRYADGLARQIGGIAYRLSTVNMTTRSGRVMSGWGSVIFELGIVGFLFLGAFVYLMWSGWKRVRGELKPVYVSSFITLYVVMLMAVPIAFPLFGYLLGVFTYLQMSDEKATPAGEDRRGGPPRAVAGRAVR